MAVQIHYSKSTLNADGTLSNKVYIKGGMLRGDDVPVNNIAVGSELIEADTGTRRLFDGSLWQEAPSQKTFTVTLTPTAQDYSGTMDTQPSEIGDAFRGGKTVIGYINGMGASIVFTQFGGNSAWGMALFSDPILGDVLIKIATDSSTQTYSTTIYPLTSAT